MHAGGSRARVRTADVDIEDDLRLRADMDPNFCFVLTEVANAERLQHTTGGTRNVWDSLSTMRPLLFERELETISITGLNQPMVFS